MKLIAREKWFKTFCKINSCEASENKAINSVACEQAHRGWPKYIPIFRPKRCKNHTLWGSIYLYGSYKGVSPPQDSDEHLFTLLFYFIIEGYFWCLLPQFVFYSFYFHPIAVNYIRFILHWSICTNPPDSSLPTNPHLIPFRAPGRKQMVGYAPDKANGTNHCVLLVLLLVWH